MGSLRKLAYRFRVEFFATFTSFVSFSFPLLPLLLCVPSLLIDSSTVACSPFLLHPSFPLPNFAVPPPLCPHFLSSCSFSPVFSAPLLLWSSVSFSSSLYFSSFYLLPTDLLLLSSFFSKNLSMKQEERGSMKSLARRKHGWKQLWSQAATKFDL